MAVTELLQELIRLDTTNPPGNETQAAELVATRLGAGGFETKILTSPEGRRSVIGVRRGRSDAPALVLLSHLDVVGVERDSWSRDPFGGEVADGHVWGRGALDMKGIVAMHVEGAIDAASSSDLSRDLIVVAVADEEAGGRQGARWLADEHPETLGFGDGRPAPEALGEGAYGLAGILDRPVMPIVVGEKSAVWVELEAKGDPGHGAFPPKNQAPLNLARAVATVTGYGAARVHPVMREQFSALSAAAGQPLATVFKVLSSPAGRIAIRGAAETMRQRGAIGALLSDSVATTQLGGGYKHNVVPGEARAALDCRLLPDTNVDDFLARMQKKLKRFSVAVNEKARNGGPVSERGPLYDTIWNVSRNMSSEPVVVPSLTAGMTDLRYLRTKGAKAYGWVPVVLTPELLETVHGHDERIPVDGLEEGTRVMTEVVRRATG